MTTDIFSSFEVGMGVWLATYLLTRVWLMFKTFLY